MSLKEWVLLSIGVIGCVKLLADLVFKAGRWSQSVDHEGEQKPRVTLDRLSWDIEQLSKDIRSIGGTMETRYAELAGRVNADHQFVRELLNWKAGIYGVLSEHFYSRDAIDRMMKQSDKDVAEVKAHVFGRREGDAA